jgi:hypothetical protein
VSDNAWLQYQRRLEPVDHGFMPVIWVFVVQILRGSRLVMVVVLVFTKKMGCVFGTLYKRRFGFYAVVHLSTCRSRVPMRSCDRQLDMGIMHFGPGARVGSTEPSSPYRYVHPAGNIAGEETNGRGRRDKRLHH